MNKGQKWDDKYYQYICELREQGVKQDEVSGKLKETYGVDISTPTICRNYRRLSGHSWRSSEQEVIAKVNTYDNLTEEQKITLEKSKLLQSQRKRQERKEIQEQARYQLLLETIQEAVTPLEFTPPQVVKPKSSKACPEELCLVLSDLHFGKRTSSYNIEVAKERFEKLTESVLQIAELHQTAYPIYNLNIFWNGDIVDGEGIYPTQSHHLDAHVVNQIFTVAPTVTQCLASLSSYFGKVKNHCVRGNHGRVSKHAHENSNFDFIFYKVLEESTKNITNMSWNVPEDWHNMVDIDSVKILHVHGNQIRMQLNLPWYGITTRVSRWASTKKVSDFDVVIISHFHTSSRVRWNNKLIFTNGTMVSGDEFALENLGLESSECQWLFSVHPNRGVTHSYELDFK